MSSFSEVENRRPPGKIVVPPEAWANTWVDRPEEDVAIGLRFVADVDLEDARVEAYRRAKELHPEFESSEPVEAMFIASFQDALVRWIIGRGTCDVNDVHKPWSLWSAAPEDMPRVTLTDVGAQLIFDAWERMRIENDIGTAVASDEDLALLPELLTRLPLIRAKSRTEELRLRRLLRFVLEALERAAPEETPESPPASDRSDAAPASP